MKAEIWTRKEACMYCDMAKNLMGVHGIKYVEKVIGGAYTVADLQEKKANVKSVPQIWIDGKYVGGYTELEHHIKGMIS